MTIVKCLRVGAHDNELYDHCDDDKDEPQVRGASSAHCLVSVALLVEVETHGITKDIRVLYYLAEGIVSSSH